MELRALRCLVAVADCGSFGGAAARLGLSQSTVSYTVRRLEDEVGAVLVERTPAGTEPTSAGLALLPHARAALHAVELGAASVRDVQAGMRGRVLVGTLSARDPLVVAGIVAAFRAERPAVEVELRSATASALVDRLREGALDLAVTAVSDLPVTDLACRELLRRELVLVCPAGHPLASGPPVPPAALRALSLVTFPDGSPIRVAMDRTLGAPPATGLRVDDPRSALVLVAAGSACALLPRGLADGAGFSEVPLATRSAQVVTVVARSSVRPPTPAAAALEEAIVARFAELGL